MSTPMVLEALSRLRVLAAHVPEMDSPYPLKAPVFAAGVTEVELCALEQVTGPLPDDYRTFLRECGEITAMDVFNGYHFLNAKDVRRIYQLEDVPDHVVSEGRSIATIPVAGDGGGNLFLLAPQASTVFKWYMESGCENREVPERELSWAFVRVAESFPDFLARVAADWEHFITHDRTWEYLSG